jgi:SSS family transporter
VNAVLLGILVYVALQLAIGMWVSRRIATEDDYLLAGRSLGFGLATFSIFATWFGAETCMGAAGAIYEDGLSGGSADPFGYGLCIVVMGLVFTVPLWKRKFTTLADLFRERYSIGVERLAVLLMAPTSIFWAAAQIQAFGKVLNAASGLHVTLAITLATVVVILYTMSGGLRADVLTDLVQGIALIIGMSVIFIAVVNALGGPGAAWGKVEPARLNLLGGPDASLLDTLEVWAIPICGSVIAQELVSRILACKSPQVARRATLTGAGLYLVIGLIPAFIGLVGIHLLPNLDDPEQILPLLAREHLSTFAYILFAGALVSAILSTVDSTLLAASALVCHNLILPLRPGLTERAKVRLNRGGVVVGGCIAFGLALSDWSIGDLVEMASACGSAGVFVVMVFGLFTSLGGRTSAFAAMLAGLGLWITGSALEWEHPYLLSLAGALGAYVLAAGWKMNARESRG